MIDVLRSALAGFNWFVLGYFLVLNMIYLMLLLVAAQLIWRTAWERSETSVGDVFANPFTPPVSVVISAYNEQLAIVASVRAALGLRYPELEVVVVDDGSTDETFERLREAFDLVETSPDVADDVPVRGVVRSLHVPSGDEPLVVVRKTNTGRRADGLNVGLNVARHPLVCCVDADSLLEGDALLRVVRPFIDDPNRVLATGGAVRAVNGSTVYRGELSQVRQPRQWLARIQVVEYLRSFLLGRTGWSRLGGLLIISGAFGLFRRDVVVAVGGYDTDSLGEDADLVASIHRWACDQGMDYQVVFVPDPVCWTEVPSDRRSLGRQRRRWASGLTEVLWKQRAMIGRPRYGRVGTVALPYFTLFELIGPFIEVAGMVAVVVGLAVGAVNIQFAVALLVVAVLFGILLSLAAILVEEASFRRYSRWRDLSIATAAACLENIGFRQLHAWWRLRGVLSAVRGRPHVWGVQSRAGFQAEEAAR